MVLDALIKIKNEGLSYSTLPSLSSTKQLHSLLVTSSSLSRNLQLLINSYSAHRDLLSARTLFYQTRTRQPIILVNSLIRSHARNHQFSLAFSLFAHLLRSSTRPDSFTFATLLRACADNFDDNGLKSIHALVLSYGVGSDLIPITTLISSYSKFGRLDDAVKMFDEMPHPDLVVYNTLLSCFTLRAKFSHLLLLPPSPPPAPEFFFCLRSDALSTK